jgi:hypothetical protein
MLEQMFPRFPRLDTPHVARRNPKTPRYTPGTFLACESSNLLHSVVGQFRHTVLCALKDLVTTLRDFIRAVLCVCPKEQMQRIAACSDIATMQHELSRGNRAACQNERNAMRSGYGPAFVDG